MNITDSFDSRYSNNELQKLKVILCYTDSPLSLPIGIWIKLCELSNALQYGPITSPSSEKAPKQEGFPNLESLLNDLSPYCTENEQFMMNNMKESVMQFENLKEMISQYQILSEYMNTDDAPSSSDAAGPDMEQLMQLISLFQADSK